MNSPNDQPNTTRIELEAPRLETNTPALKHAFARFVVPIVTGVVVGALTFFMLGDISSAHASPVESAKTPLKTACATPRDLPPVSSPVSTRLHDQHGDDWVQLWLSLSPSYGTTCEIHLESASHPVIASGPKDTSATPVNAIEVNTGRGYAHSDTEVTQPNFYGLSDATAELNYSTSFSVKFHVIRGDGSVTTITKKFDVYVDSKGEPNLREVTDHNIGTLGFSGDGQTTEHLTIDGIETEVEATLQGSVLTTVASSSFGSNRTVQTISATSTPVSFAVPTRGKPLVLTADVEVRRG
jgi:hypothetical protein